MDTNRRLANAGLPGEAAPAQAGATPPLRLLFWELTARCNLRCRHCRAEAGQDTFPGELDTGEILRVADQIAATHDPILVLTGGEPLTHPDFFRIARFCADRFTRVAMGTNGVSIDPSIARAVMASGIRRASVSIDGATASTHDAFRGLPGCFEDALRGIAHLRAARVPVQINATMTRHNDRELDALLRLALDFGADAFHLFMLVPVGCGATLGEDDRLTPERFEEVLRQLHARSLEMAGRLHIKATCAPQYMRIARQAHQSVAASPVSETSAHAVSGNSGHGGMNAMTRGCLAGSSICFISRTGDVQPCGYLPLAVGNVKHEALTDIWRNAEVFEALRNPARLTGKCGVCGYRRLCQGCRARAYAETGDYLGEEPECPYDPRSDEGDRLRVVR